MIQENNKPTEGEVLNRLANRKDLYSPLEIRSIQSQPPAPDRGLDARITLAWRGRTVSFLVEINTRTAPKLVNETAWRLKSGIRDRKENLLLLVPFLSKAVVEILEREGMSGLDLNGNYLIHTPEMVAIRLDRGNQYPESQPIKKIFSGASSLVGRLFLVEKRRFRSVNEVCAAIQRLGGSLSLSAVSKVLKGLVDELVIEKGKGGIALLQPEKLLERLAEGYRPPKILGTARLRLPADSGVPYRFGEPGFFETFADSRWVLSGESSASRYAIMADNSVSKIYIADYQPFMRFQDDRFYNVLVHRTEESFPFFDVRQDRAMRWASPVQCYLELSRLDKREKEVAETAREEILKALK